jgi:hypothetical protein
MALYSEGEALEALEENQAQAKCLDEQQCTRSMAILPMASPLEAFLSWLMCQAFPQEVAQVDPSSGQFCRAHGYLRGLPS